MVRIRKNYTNLCLLLTKNKTVPSSYLIFDQLSVNLLKFKKNVLVPFLRFLNSCLKMNSVKNNNSKMF